MMMLVRKMMRTFGPINDKYKDDDGNRPGYDFNKSGNNRNSNIFKIIRQCDLAV